jgi:tetratricopeptide (TPR) repeat protein
MIGWVYFKKNDIKTALEYYEKAIARWDKYFKKIGRFHLSEKFSPVWYRIGIIFKIKSEMVKAKQYFENSIKSSPNSIFAKKSRKELDKIEI